MLSVEDINACNDMAQWMWTNYGRDTALKTVDKAIDTLSVNNEEIPLARANVIKTELERLDAFYAGSDEEVAERIAAEMVKMSSYETALAVLEWEETNGKSDITAKAVLTKEALLRLKDKNLV